MNLSISRIKLFKSCRRAYELKYIEGMIPVEPAETLQTGARYHERLEELYKTGDVDTSDLSKEAAMAVAYKKHIYPHFKCKSVEEWQHYELPTGDTLIGRVDGIAEDGRLVEHKTTGSDITEEYEYNLQWDEQLIAYMLMTGAREVWYTVIRKPTIRQKKGESEEEFFHRMVSWYDEDTDSKIRLMLIGRTDAEVEEFAAGLSSMAEEIKNTKNFYKNTNHCKCWGRRCEYASICLDYDPNREYVEFVKNKEDYYESAKF